MELTPEFIEEQSKNMAKIVDATHTTMIEQLKPYEGEQFARLLLGTLAALTTSAIITTSFKGGEFHNLDLFHRTVLDAILRATKEKEKNNDQ